MNLPKPKLNNKSALELWNQEHSEYAKEQIILCNQGMVGMILKKMNLNILDEDLFATGILGLVKAVNTFDFDKGFAFSTYAAMCIKNEILMTLRKKRVSIAFSLDDNANLGNGEKVPYLEMIACDRKFEEEVIANRLFSEFQKSLSSREKRIIELYLNEKTQREIAEISGISQANVSRILKKLLEKYKNRFTD